MDPVEPVDDVLGRVAELAQGQLIMMAAPGQCEEETVCMTQLWKAAFV